MMHRLLSLKVCLGVFLGVFVVFGVCCGVWCVVFLGVFWMFREIWCVFLGFGFFWGVCSVFWDSFGCFGDGLRYFWDVCSGLQIVLGV